MGFTLNPSEVYSTPRPSAELDSPVRIVFAYFCNSDLHKSPKKIKKKWLNEKDKVNFKIYDIQPS